MTRRIGEQRAARKAERAAAERAFYAEGGACFACRDTGWQIGALNALCGECDRGQALLAERISARTDQLARQLDLPLRRRSETLLTYAAQPLTGQQREALAHTERYLQDFERHLQDSGGRFMRMSGALWTGKRGVGKTGLLIGALRAISGYYAQATEGAPPLPGPLGARAPLRFLLSADMLDLLKAGYDRTASAQESHLAVKRELQQTPLLALDDLGAERVTEWVAEQLFVVFNWRYEHMLPTLVTSNYTLDELEARIGGRTVDRLREMCETIAVAGQNLRRS